MTEEKKEEKVEQRYTLAEVPTQTAIVIKDNKEDKIYSGEQIFLEILNKVEKIEKAVA